MFQSIGFRFLLVAVLALAMSIPLFFAGEVIDARADYGRATGESLSREWGGPQTFSGPQLVIPVEADVIVRRTRELTDPATGLVRRTAAGEPMTESHDEAAVEARDPVYLYPDLFDLTITSTTEERHRGIFVVPVFQARAAMRFTLPAARAAEALEAKERLIWDRAELRVYVTDNRALRGTAELTADGAALQL
jgi:inner membrane protein